MKIAVVGLAYTHPYTYTQILQRTGHVVTHVWDDVPERVREFSERFGVPPVASPEDIPAGAVDGVITTSRLPERIGHALLFLEKGVPTYTSKPAAVTLDQLKKMASAVRRTGTPWFSTSVLRYAPALRSLKIYLDRGKAGMVVQVRATSCHFISHYMREPGVWQDDPKRGGGSIINMGVHGLEMLSVLVGPGIRRVWCAVGRRFHKESLSEDAAVIALEWKDGLPGVIEVPCGVKGESFGAEVFGSEAILKFSIPKGDVQEASGAALGDADPWVEFGYAGTMEAFIGMCRTRRMPVPLEETETLAEVLIRARESAATGRPVDIGPW
jgi:predicted dehydrogenase